MGDVIRFPTERRGFRMVPVLTAAELAAMTRHPVTAPRRTAPEPVTRLTEPVPAYGVDEAIDLIHSALKARSGRAWAVTRCRGDLGEWIRITCRPSSRVGAVMPDTYRRELERLLSLDQGDVDGGGVLVGPGESRVEWVDRAQGRMPRVFGAPITD